MNKPKKSKPLYSLLSNIVFLLRQSWQLDRVLLISILLQVPVLVLMPLATAYLSKYVVELVTQGASAEKLITYVLALSAGIMLLNLWNRALSVIIQYRAYGSRFLYIGLNIAKMMDTDYENIENTDGQTKMQKALHSIGSDNSGTQQVFTQLVKMGSHVIGIAAYTAVILTVSPWLIPILCGVPLASYWLHHQYNHWVHRNKDRWVPIDRKLGYIRTKAGDFKAAKDTRLYGMSDWFKPLSAQLLAERLDWHRKSGQRGYAVDAASAILTLVKDGAVYGFLIWEISLNGMSAAQFVWLFALVTQYSNWLFGVVDGYNALQKTSLSTCDLREFLDMPDRSNRGPGVPLPAHPPAISFRNLTYRYPMSDSTALRELNFTIRAGEKIAIVGPNGAGKTTLVKLLCGLYHPSEGDILVDGINLAQYNRDAYYALLSVVFQEIGLLPVSIAKNIALSEDKAIDKRLLERVLKLSGLYDKVQGLPEKENTLLLKSVQDGATDLSGGELQKLALARALYKQGTIIVLDEPTAALDPLAEHEMYVKYSELTADATSVFISHRLSSTRFCDRILYMEAGEIAEMGSHQELMQLGGKYAKMFNIQSHYYKEAVEA